MPRASRKIKYADLDPALQDWKVDAACRDYDPEYWFPSSKSESAMGKEVCHYCPVRETCLLRSLENNEIFGTWGGVDEWDRAQMMNRKHRK